MDSSTPSGFPSVRKKHSKWHNRKVRNERDIPQCQKVILKMDVPHKEHTHIIGKGANKIQKFLERSECQIHFPDVNKNRQNKSNTVAITGKPGSVQKACSWIRGSLPVIINIEHPFSNSAFIRLLQNIHLMKVLENKYNIMINITTGIHISAAVRCSQSLFFSQHLEGIMELMKIFAGCEKLFLVFIQLDIEPRGHNIHAGVVDHIADVTSTHISFCDTHNSLRIYGSASCAFIAWQNLMDELPVSFSFEIPLEISINYEDVNVAVKEKEIDLTMIKKPSMNKQIIILTTAEKNLKILFDLQRTILSTYATGKSHLASTSDMEQCCVSGFCDNIPSKRNGIISETCAKFTSFESSKNEMEETVKCPDYQQQKKLAVKAMHRPIENVIQRPINIWVGYGFSMSFPSVYMHPKPQQSRSQHVSKEKLLSDISDSSSTSRNIAPITHLPNKDKTSNKNDTLNFGYSNCFENVLSQTLCNSGAWDDDLLSLLHSKGLQRYVDLFLQNEIDVKLFASLTSYDLEEMKIKWSDRRRIMMLVSEVKCQLSDPMKKWRFFRSIPNAE